MLPYTRGVSMRYLTIVFSLLATIAVCDHDDNASVKTTLRWRLQPGQKFHVRVTRSRDSVMSGGTCNLSEKMRCVIDESWCIESVDTRGTAKVALIIERMRLSMHSPDGDVNIDSATTNESLPGDIAIQGKFLKEDPR